jgi:hypothetical protein
MDRGCGGGEWHLATHLVQQHRSEAHDNLHLTKQRFDLL